MGEVVAVVLAAGEGKRMKSKNSKVVHKVCGKPLIKWVYEAIKKSGINDSVFVVGHREDQVRACLGNEVSYAVQDIQLGTGHAIMQAEEFLKGREGIAVVLYGDSPLITECTIMNAIQFHKDNANSATVITADLDDPTGYGRIIRGVQGEFLKIVEQKDANEAERSVREINSGIYCFNIKDLTGALKELSNNNSQGEYYLTDTLEILMGKGSKVGAVKIADSNEILGINDRIQMVEASEIIRKRINRRHMAAGVTIIDPDSVYIDDEVKIGIDTIIYPGSIIEGETVIGEDCIIGPGSRLVNSKIGNGTEINNSVVQDGIIGNDTYVGPFAYVRSSSVTGNKVR